MGLFCAVNVLFWAGGVQEQHGHYQFGGMEHAPVAVLPELREIVIMWVVLLLLQFP
jgi:hypothetical protein